MKILKTLFFAAVSRLNMSWVMQQSSLDVLVPYQHLVSDEPVPWISPLYGFKNLRQFEADLDLLLRHFQPVTLSELILQRQSGQSFGKKSFLLTFDDGLRQVYDTVMPVLLRKGVPATLFVCPAFVDNKALFYDLKKALITNRLQTGPVSTAELMEIGRLLPGTTGSSNDLIAAVRGINYMNQSLTDRLGEILRIDYHDFVQKEQPFMSQAQIRTFLSKGFEVGAHSWDHPLYSLLSLEEQLRQTIDSVNWVRETFNLPYSSFAFPHVDAGVPARFFDLLFSTPGFSLDLVLGNQTARMEPRSQVVHRYIGENPHLDAATMAKAVLSAHALREKLDRSFVKRS